MYVVIEIPNKSSKFWKGI